MRYESRSFRSHSYLLKQGHQELHTNKENMNHFNQPPKPNGKQPNSPHSLKILHRMSHSTHASCLSTTQQPIPLKEQYTSLVQEEYSQDILHRLCEASSYRPGILSKHTITASLRSKMVDWMIQVLSSYKMSEETFFRSVHLMDAYLQACPRLQVKDLHLVGVTAMFAAGKYEEIHPLKLSIIYDKIARRKFRKQDILQKESEMISTLDFKLQIPSVYDLARHVLQQLQIPVNQSSQKYLSKIILYLSKMGLFSSELAQERAATLAGAVVFIGLKTLQQVDSSVRPEEWLEKIGGLLGLEQEGVIEVSRKVLDMAKNFSKYYPSLTNLKKFNKFEYGVD